MNYKTTLMH